MSIDHGETVSARTLLLAFLELQGLCPKLSQWTEGALAFSPPRLVRLQQLAALFRAFRIPWDPPSFTRGKFIQPDDPRYDSLLLEFAAEMPEGTNDRRDQLPKYFGILFDYRRRVGEVLTFSSGVLAASGLYLRAYQRARDLNRIIEENVAIVDDAMVTLISPEAMTFTVEQLVREYGYPDTDLSALDLEWL